MTTQPTLAQQLENMLVNATDRREITQARLLNHAEYLARQMEYLAGQLRSESPMVNELGEVQSVGVEIDRLCAVLSEQQRYERTLRKLAEPWLP